MFLNQKRGFLVLVLIFEVGLREMRTRSGVCYQTEVLVVRKREEKRKMIVFSSQEYYRCRKRMKSSEEEDDAGKCNFLDRLPDDILSCILSKLVSRATSPPDFLSVLLTCKRLYGLGLKPWVLVEASRGVFAVPPERWSDSAQFFMKRCVDAGNPEACFVLGMIRFYCLEDRSGGASLMARAAILNHADALYSLAVIQFNGSGGTKNDKDLRAGVALCARAASLGHIDALRDFGHCLQDGYGVKQNITEGRRFLVRANAHELASMLNYNSTPTETCRNGELHRCRRIDPSKPQPSLASLFDGRLEQAGYALLSDFGCNVPVTQVHPANRFLTDWFHLRPPGNGLRLCSFAGCGKPETRKHEFRRCSVCGNANYCSRACQAFDWKIRHKRECLECGEGIVGDEEDEQNSGGGEMDGLEVEVGDGSGEMDGNFEQ